jgi:putrescine transport system ATP-binding protein
MSTAGNPTKKPADASAYLRIEKLTKEFDGVAAVKDVSLDIERGELFALLGSSGCGKSTLLRMLAGFETPTAGRIILDGQDITAIPPYRRPINMMFQSYALFPHLSVADNIAFGLKRAGMARAEISERVTNLLSLVQLSAYGRRKPHQLSGGQQQRVALARSLALRPQLLLLDEPLGALDKKLRQSTQLELVNILEQVGVTCVMVTHDQEEAMTMSRRIAVMSEGQFLQIGTPSEVYETPNCRFVADFIGEVNLFEGTLVVDEPDHVVIETPECRHWVGHGVSGTIGMPLSVAVRPEKVQIERTKPEDEFNAVEGEIVDLAYLGSHTNYHLKLATGKRVAASVPNSARHREEVPTWGDRVWASWSRSAIVVLTD